MFGNLLKNIFGITTPRGTSVNNRTPVTPATSHTGTVAATGSDWAALASTNRSKTIILYDPKGNPLRINTDDEITHGGEGVIYPFAKNNGILIKVCRDETLRNKSKMAVFRKRLNAMMRLEDCRKAEFLAWPMMPVNDVNGEAIGFVMRKCTGRTFRALFAPCQVKRFFPGWNRIHVTRVALNFLDAVRMLARHKVLVNDFNPSNFLIDKTGAVRLIDCDSFQIPTESGEQPFMTTTHTAEFAAPELLLHPELFKLPRTPEQVRFSLAVVIYMILMSGLHPYARCGGGDPATNLKSGKCPLDKNSGVRMPVSWYKSVSWLTPSLRNCFQRMFTEGFAYPARRPYLEELRFELTNFIEVMENSKSENQRAILPTTAKRGK
ncbi:MAG: hypothetical protein IJS15_15370 [Victivallales bacterium]|nr:hypothetical protein [Victivallales bacterium]